MWFAVAVSFGAFFWMSHAAKKANREFQDYPTLPINWGPTLQPNSFASRAMALALFPNIALVTLLITGVAPVLFVDEIEGSAAEWGTLIIALIFVVIQWGYHVAVRRYLKL